MSVAISMVMLDEEPTLTAEQFAAEYAEHWPDDPAPEEIEGEDNSISFSLGDTHVVAGLMPGPIPWSDLEGPSATSIFWENATAEVKAHQFHYILTVLGELEPIEQSVQLTKAAAALMSACDEAIGVYWCNATMVLPKPIFNEFAEKVLPEGPPLHIWVDFRVGPNDDGMSSAGFTTGMKALGHMEIEASKSPEPPGELRERLFGLADYLIANGPIVNDGDTIGEDEYEKIQVAYGKSKFGIEGKVMKLQYSGSSHGKAWWKFW